MEDATRYTLYRDLMTRAGLQPKSEAEWQVAVARYAAKDLHGEEGDGWIGVDLDGTLARYDGWDGADQIGEPIPKMLERVKRWLEDGRDVRILTARVAPGSDGKVARGAIERWCEQHLGQKLPITHAKDRQMLELWDDRAVQVEPNTGKRLDGERDRYTMTAQEIDEAVKSWRPPSDAQAEAGNYPKVKVPWNGRTISIENPAGTRRKPEWPPLKNHYGYLNRTLARDSDQIDVFLGPTMDSDIVFVVDQEHPSGRYDEPKVLIGWTNAADAKAGYLSNYQDGWHCGQITAMTIDQFKQWLEHGDTRARVAQQVSRYTLDASDPARSNEAMAPAPEPQDLQQDLQTVADRYSLSASEKRELLDRYCQEIAGPAPRNLDHDLAQVARELDLTPAEVQAVKRQYEAGLAGDVEREPAKPAARTHDDAASFGRQMRASNRALVSKRDRRDLLRQNGFDPAIHTEAFMHGYNSGDPQGPDPDAPITKDSPHWQHHVNEALVATSAEDGGVYGPDYPREYRETAHSWQGRPNDDQAREIWSKAWTQFESTPDDYEDFPHALRIAAGGFHADDWDREYGERSAADIERHDREMAEKEERQHNPDHIAQHLSDMAEYATKDMASGLTSRQERAAARAAVQQHQAHQTMLARGWTPEYISDSGSVYYRKGNKRFRIADHDVPATEERQYNRSQGGFSWADSGNQLILPVHDIESELDSIEMEPEDEDEVAQ